MLPSGIGNRIYLCESKCLLISLSGFASAVEAVLLSCHSIVNAI